MPEDDDARLRDLEEEAGEARTVRASFDWVMQFELDTALEQQEGLTEFVDNRHLVVKTAALEAAIDPWYSGTTLASESGLSLSRATPLPPT